MCSTACVPLKAAIAALSYCCQAVYLRISSFLGSRISSALSFIMRCRGHNECQCSAMAEYVEFLSLKFPRLFFHVNDFEYILTRPRGCDLDFSIVVAGMFLHPKVGSIDHDLGIR